MSNLLAPNSHMGRIQQKLGELMPDCGDMEQYFYVGCCIGLEGEDITKMVDSAEEAGRDELYAAIEERCAGLSIWKDVVGYTEMELDLKNDWSVSFGKGLYQGKPALWIDYSRVEFIWVQPFDKEVELFNTIGVTTGRMSCKEPNLANKPKCKHGNSGPCMDCRMDPVEMKVIPYAILASELEQWGCPYCGYAKSHIGVNTKTGMPAIAAGTFVRYCNSCRKFAYALAEGADRSTIPFGGQEEGTTAFYPRLGAHPRHGVRPHHDKVEQGEGEGSESPESSVDGSEQRLKS